MISYFAIIILNTIALIAILVANREFSKALREMDKFSSSRASDRADEATCRSNNLAAIHWLISSRIVEPGRPSNERMNDATRRLEGCTVKRVRRANERCR
jgi:FtsZ-interacting cell division protein ZipA